MTKFSLIEKPMHNDNTRVLVFGLHLGWGLTKPKHKF